VLTANQNFTNYDDVMGLKSPFYRLLFLLNYTSPLHLGFGLLSNLLELYKTPQRLLPFFERNFLYLLTLFKSVRSNKFNLLESPMYLDSTLLSVFKSPLNYLEGKVLYLTFTLKPFFKFMYVTFTLLNLNLNDFSFYYRWSDLFKLTIFVDVHPQI
jgi:hypothetical protein